jgi:transglutaminase-like putative cysteine protease
MGNSRAPHCRFVSIATGMVVVGDLAGSGEAQEKYPARLAAGAGYLRLRAQSLIFGYEHSRATRTAFEAHQERRGVCRDYAHLAVAFCRCLNIPARYCTGYITDIGLPPPYAPMDFAAWIEVYLGDRWYAFDPRNNAPRIGRILIAQGRDAADVPLTHTFGSGTLSEFRVWADEVPE